MPSIAGSTAEIRECDMVDAVGEFSSRMPADLVPLRKMSVETTTVTLDKMKLDTNGEHGPKVADMSVDRSPRMPFKAVPANIGEMRIPAAKLNAAKEEAPAAPNKPLATMAKTMDRMRSNGDLREPPKPKPKPTYEPSVEAITVDKRVFITHIEDHRTIYVYPHARFDHWQDLVNKIDKIGKKGEPLSKPPAIGHIVAAKSDQDRHYGRALITRLRASEKLARVEFLVRSHGSTIATFEYFEYSVLCFPSEMCRNSATPKLLHLTNCESCRPSG